MCSIAGIVSSEDQVIEKYYYCLHMDSMKQKVGKYYLIGAIAFLFFGALYFYLNKLSPQFVLLFLPLVIGGYFASPWLYWKHSIDPLWRKMYTEYTRFIRLTEQGKIIVLDEKSSQYEESVFTSEEVNKVLHNSKHIIIFFGSENILVNVEGGDHDAQQQFMCKLRDVCSEAVFEETKVKNDLF